MSFRASPARNIGTVDVKLLRVFVAVVQAGGFTAAQSRLNVSQPTISVQMANLEARLGIRLCDRGRKRFALTTQGERVYNETIILFRALERFNYSVGDVSEELLGELRIGLADASISNPNLNFQEALATFKRVAPKVHIELQIGSPADLEHGLINRSIDIAVGPLRKQREELRYDAITKERNFIYCAKPHPFFERPEDSIQAEDLENMDFVSRDYLKDWINPINVEYKFSASVWHMEAALILIRTGRFLGYLPEHFARRWVENGTLRAILPDLTVFESQFLIATRRSGDSRTTEQFLSLLK